MKYILITLLAFSLIRCNNAQKDEIPVFNNINFHLEDGESTVNITQTTIDLYDSVFNGQFSEIPLYKKIQHQQYSLYLGLPFNTNLKKLKHQKYEIPDSLVLSKTANDSSFIIEYKIDKTFAIEYATQINKKSIMFLSALTTKKEIADSLLNMKKITERFIIKK